MVTLFNTADIKVEVANCCAAMATLIDQDDTDYAVLIPNNQDTLLKCYLTLHQQERMEDFKEEHEKQGKFFIRRCHMCHLL